MKKILITGCAGFIGFHLSQKLFHNYEIHGIDSVNDYYDLDLKETRLKNLNTELTSFEKIDISNKKQLSEYFKKHNFDLVINLAAQAGVRYSLHNPQEYIDSNIKGFHNLLECCVNSNIKKLFFASSSSVYGANKKIPFSEEDVTDSPVSLYAATKKANETLAFSYSSLYDIETVGLRFFTVYGPYGRPDMAYYSFSEKILNDEEIVLFNNGNLQRDFTYIDDIIEAIDLLVAKSLTSKLTYNIQDNKNYFLFNIGNNSPVELHEFVEILEESLEKKAKIRYAQMQKGDVFKTFADIERLNKEIGYKPKTSLKKGLTKFINWYKSYKGIN